jgi:hypothetical protein
MSSNRPQSIYRIKEIDTEWGSFGSVLISGFLGFDDADEDEDDYVERDFELLRTGPFVPPIFFPGGSCMVDETTKEELLEPGFQGLHFTPVKVGKMVRCDWHLWDRTKDFDYDKFPDIEIYCPEDLIKRSKSDADLLSSAGTYWKLKGGVAQFEWIELSDSGDTLSWSKSTINELDFFTPSDTLVYVSERVRAWMEPKVSEWVKFEAVTVLD